MPRHLDCETVTKLYNGVKPHRVTYTYKPFTVRVLTSIFSLSPASLAQLGDWVSEKMLMARDSSRDETQKLHKKWLKHQAFMAELAQNKEWLDKIEKVSERVVSSQNIDL